MRRTEKQIIPEDYPEAVRPWLENAVIYDSSCSEQASVLYLEKDTGYYLKTASPGKLKAEAEMTAYFHTLGLSSPVLYYGSGERDCMITERIPGEDCTFAEYIGDPRRLCELTATLLRRLHELDAPDCPVRCVERYAASVTDSLEGKHYEADLFPDMFDFASREEARETAAKGLSHLEGDVLIHGDYCLPNILLKDWKFSGFIDLGNSGIGDRHMDILWGIWTLKYNLKTTRYTDRFLDAYGRDRIDPDRLREIAAMEMITQD